MTNNCEASTVVVGEVAGSAASSLIRKDFLALELRTAKRLQRFGHRVSEQGRGISEAVSYRPLTASNAETADAVE